MLQYLTTKCLMTSHISHICISTKNHIGIHKWFDTIVSTILGHVVVADGSMQSSGIVKDFKLGIEKKMHLFLFVCILRRGSFLS